MAELPCGIEGREYGKFVCNNDDEIAIRTVSEVTPAGLANGGKWTPVTLNDTTWVALPPTPLPNRNALAIQNYETGTIIRINYDTGATNAASGVIADNQERFYVITDAIPVYARLPSGTADVTVLIEELS